MLDVYDDSELDVIKDKELPTFVKESTIDSKVNYDRFAVKVAKQEGEVEHKCPIDDKASTWLSAQYYDNVKDDLTKKARNIIGNNISEACDRFDIDYTDEGLDSKPEDDIIKENEIYNNKIDNNEEIEGEYLIPSQERYNVKTAADVEDAVEYFEKYSADFDLDEKREYSKNLVKVAEDHEVEIKENNILKFASKTEKISDSFEIGIKARRELMRGDEESQETLDTLMEKKSEIPGDVMVDLVEEFDKQAGLTGEWGRKIPEPDITVKSKGEDLEKIAASMTYKGKSITGDDIRNIEDAELEKHFHEDQIEDLKDKPQDVFYALPDPHKQIIVDLIK